MTELTEFSVYVNPTIVAICIVLGKFIKSSSIMKKIPNDTIPFILIVLSVIISFVMSGVNGDAISTGIFSAATAVGVHQQIKQGFKSRTVDTIEDLESLKDSGTSNDEEIPEIPEE